MAVVVWRVVGMSRRVVRRYRIKEKEVVACEEIGDILNVRRECENKNINSDLELGLQGGQC